MEGAGQGGHLGSQSSTGAVRRGNGAQNPSDSQPAFVLRVAGVLLENFPVCKELLIPPGTQNYVVRMRLYDANKRLLCLTIRIVLRAQGALKILISAPYWLINKTGEEQRNRKEPPVRSGLWSRCLTLLSGFFFKFLYMIP